MPGSSEDPYPIVIAMCDLRIAWKSITSHPFRIFLVSVSKITLGRPLIARFELLAFGLR
jgi:hypothetical protein